MNEFQARFTTGSKLYVILLSLAGQLMWNGSAFVQVSPADWPTCAIPLTEVRGLVGGVVVGTGLYYGDCPATVPPGTYTALICLQAGPSPASADQSVSDSNSTFTWAGVPAGPVPTPTTTVTLRFVNRLQSDPRDPSSPLVPTDPDGMAVVLAAPPLTPGGPPPAYGAARSDTLASVVASGTPMSRVSAGVYQYTFQAAQDGLAYDFWPSYSLGGVAIPPPRLRFTPTPAAPPTPAGYYATLDDLYAEFGRPQVDDWSNVNNSGEADGGMPVPDYARIQRALTMADSWINARLRGCRYALPLTGELAMAMANTWAARHAGRYLYQARGAGDKKSPGYTKYDAMIREAEQEMAMVRSGAIRLDALDRFPQPSAPVSGRFNSAGW